MDTKVMLLDLERLQDNLLPVRVPTCVKHSASLADYFLSFDMDKRLLFWDRSFYALNLKSSNPANGHRKKYTAKVWCLEELRFP